jgi:hypothetical protein
MSPTIRVWGLSGPLGMFVSGLITTIMLAVGAISVQGVEPDCSGVGFGDCLGRIMGNALGQAIGLFILIMLVFLLFLVVAWFLTGMLAGWQVVRHLRRLEPGITAGQGWKVSAGWGCGALVAAIVMALMVGVVSKVLGL